METSCENLIQDVVRDMKSLWVCFRGVVGELERNRLLEIWNRGSHRTSKTDD
ncbi:hypothetical protein Csa_010631, partial [Cucumis sativus]